MVWTINKEIARWPNTVVIVADKAPIRLAVIDAIEKWLSRKPSERLS